MTSLLKICGITDMEFALEADRLGFDFLGFIFHKKSPRFITEKDAGKIRRAVKCRAVGVFVDSSEEEIRQIAAQVRLNVIQLHGKPDRKLAESLKHDFTVWQAISSEACPDDFPADAFLVDSANPGSGQKSDWNLAERLIADDKKVVLAGGISEKNFEEALAIHPYALDFNSSLETELGKKSVEKLHFLYRRMKDE